MKKRNESFICAGCGIAVAPALKTCRNHCPACFLSLHVDGAIPGDRNTSCGGKMIPFEFVQTNGGVKIHFVCTKCHKKHRNKLAVDDCLVDLSQQIRYWSEKFRI